MGESPQSDSPSVKVLARDHGSPPHTRADVQERLDRASDHQAQCPAACGITERPAGKPVRLNKRRLTSPLFMVGYFAVLNVIMYFTIHKFWIGGSSFLPMIGMLGDGNKFLFAFLVNIGVIVGAAGTVATELIKLSRLDP